MRARTSFGGPGHTSRACTTFSALTSRALEPNQRWLVTHSPSRSSSRKERSLVVVIVRLSQLEPEEPPGRERQEVRQFPDAREARSPEHLLREAPRIIAQIELDRLRRAREV